jgi:type II secretory pathway component PulK
MIVDATRPERKAGFALILVLSTLTILTLLFAATNNRVLGQLQANNSELTLNSKNATNASLLQFAQNWKVAHPAETGPVSITFNNQHWQFEFQDVGGLIDLNTAQPELRQTLFKHLAASASEAAEYEEKYIAWRRSGKRLIRIDDLYRILERDARAFSRLDRFATISSGRSGISPDHAPDAVLELITERSGNRDALVQDVPETLRSSPSNVTFQVRVRSNDTESRILGTIHILGAQGSAVILSLK